MGDIADETRQRVEDQYIAHITGTCDEDCELCAEEDERGEKSVG